MWVESERARQREREHWIEREMEQKKVIHKLLLKIQPKNEAHVCLNGDELH